MPQTPVATDESVADLETSVDVPESTSEAEAQLGEADLLIEDVSIDGMCGVY